MTNVPLICDSPTPGRYIITVPEHLSDRAIERLRAEWERLVASAPPVAIVLEPGIQIYGLEDAPAWPGALDCAA